MPITPHGGKLVERLLTGSALDSAKKQAGDLPRIKVDTYAAFDIDGIGKGIFSPLSGFPGKAEVESILDTMHLTNGVPWTIPLFLAVSQEDGDKLNAGSKVAIEDDEGDLCAILDLKEKFSLDHKEVAKKIYQTDEDAHPGAQYTMSLGPVFLAGDLDVLKARTVDHQDYNLTPAQTRAKFEENGWKRIVAFQTRNPIHRAHEYLTKCALENCDGLLIHPLMGTTKSDDIPGDVRMKCYQELMKGYYAHDHVMLSIMPVNMRYAGPKEAVMHAIVRKNYGCTHFIVGRDHAGVGSYYGTYDAHQIFDKFDADAIGISIMLFDHSFFCKACGSMGSIKTCPHDKENHVFLSGTKVREMLQAGEMPPEEFTRPEVAKELIAWAKG